MTRILNRLRDTLDTAEATKLKQMKQSLVEKGNLLTKLDGEIIEEVEEDYLESEIEQADMIKEDISFAIISIEEALKAKEAPPPVSGRCHRRPRTETTPSTSSESGEGERHSPVARGSTVSSGSHATSDAVGISPDRSASTRTLTFELGTPPSSGVSMSTTTTTVSSFPGMSGCYPVLQWLVLPNLL